MTIRKTIEPGTMIPNWYGVAWYDYARRLAVCYPIPLNVAVRIVYKAWGWLMFPLRSEAWWERRQAAVREQVGRELRQEYEREAQKKSSAMLAVLAGAVAAKTGRGE